MESRRVSVFGLGYVGTVTAASLARDGHDVVGVDVNPEKVELIVSGNTPVVEPGLEAALEEAVRAERLTATTDPHRAVERSEVSLVTVGTPPAADGTVDLESVFTVCHQIAEGVGSKGEPHVVVIRSTSPPGTLEECRRRMLGVIDDEALHLAFNPEFLREGSALADYASPPFTVIGTTDPVAEREVRNLYTAVDAPVFVVEPEVAELVKYVCNAWHGAKVAFANEVGRIASLFGIDGRKAMEIVTRDTKLNVSDAYMRPGFAYGGSCLPKDLDALLQIARSSGLSVPLLNAVPESNEDHIELAVRKALDLGSRRFGLFGLAFKPETDDLRESPSVKLVKQLLGEGCEVRIYDPAVHRGRLLGTNLEYIRSNLPHFESILVSRPEEALMDDGLVVVAHATPEFRRILLGAPEGTRVLDLAGVFDEAPRNLDYHGIAW